MRVTEAQSCLWPVCFENSVGDAVPCPGQAWQLRGLEAGTVLTQVLSAWGLSLHLQLSFQPGPMAAAGFLALALVCSHGLEQLMVRGLRAPASRVSPRMASPVPLQLEVLAATSDTCVTWETETSML